MAMHPVLSDIFEDPTENMSVKSFHSKILGERAISAPPKLSSNVGTKPSRSAKTLNKTSLEEVLDMLPLRPHSETWRSLSSIKSCPTKMEYGWGKEKMWISDVFTEVGSLSRAMEREKDKQKLSIGRGNLLGLSSNEQNETAWIPKLQMGRTYQDWRGVILSDTMPPYSTLTNKEHQERLIAITKRQRQKKRRHRETKVKICCEERKTSKKSYSRRRRTLSIVHEKVKRIGPHLDIFEAFKHLRRRQNKDKYISSAIIIQKTIRGWLVRCKMHRLKLKARSHGPNLLAVVKEYRKVMFRIKRRCGILDPTTPLIFDQLEDYLDHKRFYEMMFSKRDCLKEMDRNELPKFFRDCGLFPTLAEVNNTMKMVLEGADSKIKSISKAQAIEMTFMLYPPRGLKLTTAAAPRSTWLKPIVDGEDGYKYLVPPGPLTVGPTPSPHFSCNMDFPSVV
ncbi:IQ domain-containing protein M isoform X2 [Zootoca vivipara]|uniref:IQ domain-containing protein M isoform X2 n=1 Tax=Zootoca vivipara TaxID=8524 RepID=UPI00293BCB55|nr:IQ domain-containing protein M isoform X2 [Zootoca vivipara]